MRNVGFCPTTHTSFSGPAANLSCFLQETCNKFVSFVSCCFDALQELSGVYRRLDEAKQQMVGLQNEQAQLFAKCEAETQSAAMATAELVTLEQELADSCGHAQAMAAHLASAQEVSCVPSHASCAATLVA